jgi:hypothetical protein
LPFVGGPPAPAQDLEDLFGRLNRRHDEPVVVPVALFDAEQKEQMELLRKQVEVQQKMI